MTEIVAGSWPQPLICVDVHTAYQGTYVPTENAIIIDKPDCTMEFLLLLLAHELTHWAHFMALRETEASPWLGAFSLDSSIFHRARQAMELAACWAPDWTFPDYKIMDAEARRARRIVKHRDGSRSWRHIPLADPISEEERIVCSRLSAIEGGF